MLTLRNQLICAYSFIPFSIALGLGLFVLSQWLPPFAPDLSAADMAALFRNHMSTRIGIAILAFFSPFFLGLWVAMAAQMRRMEGPGYVWSTLMLLAAVLQVLGIQLPCFPLLALMFRPELNDQFFLLAGTVLWFMALGAAGQATLQMSAIGFCILTTGSENPVFPRWLGYVNFFGAFSAIPGISLMFVKRGPFAYNGAIGFWFVLIGFSIWGIANFIWTILAINKQIRDERNVATVHGVSRAIGSGWTADTSLSP